MKSTFIVLAVTGMSLVSCSKLNPNPQNLGDEIYVKSKNGKLISHSDYLDEMQKTKVSTLAPLMGYITCWVNVSGVPRQGLMCTQSNVSECSAYTTCIVK